MEFVLSDEQLLDIIGINKLRVENDLPPIDVTETTVRRCLKCDTPFLSLHKFNRVCDWCFEENCESGGLFESVGCPIEFNEKENLEGFRILNDPIKNPTNYKELHNTLDTADYKERMARKKKHFTLLEEDRRPIVANTGAKGLVIKNSALLPHPCDIQPIPGQMGIRSALRRRNLQCFEVTEQLSDIQVWELDRALSEYHSWILLSPHVDIDTGLFVNKVVRQ